MVTLALRLSTVGIAVIVAVGGGVKLNVGINVCVGEVAVKVSVEGTPIDVLSAIGVGGTVETLVGESVQETIVAMTRINKYPFFMPRFYYRLPLPRFASIAIPS